MSHVWGNIADYHEAGGRTAKASEARAIEEKHKQAAGARFKSDRLENSTTVYPSIKGNYQSALSAMRVKLANSDMGDELMNDCDDDDDANEEAGEDNIPASEIIYGEDGEILNQDPNNLVVTTQAPAVQ